MMENAQSETDFGGHLGDVVCPIKFITDSETQMIEWLFFFKRIAEKVDENVCLAVLLEREICQD